MIVAPDRLASILLAVLAILCFAGLCWLIWDGRERRKPAERPAVPNNQRLPPA